MIARSFINQVSFVVWGNGEQIRNWPHVDDIVEGTLLAAEKIEDGAEVNLGTNERTRVIDAVREVLRYTGKDHLPVLLDRNMPTGPMNRVADNRFGEKAGRLGAEGQVC
jgi:nucleoside-diphosphate-sugar epimerase